MFQRAALLLLPLLACEPLRALPTRSSDDLLRRHLWEQTLALPESERPKVGLVFSAGSVRGVAHIGVLRVLEDAGFPVDVVSGTSMGAIVGALYAAGVPASRMREVPRRIAVEAQAMFSRMRLLRLLLTESLISAEGLDQLIREEIGEKRFDQLPKPFACVAMDLRTGEKIVFREGPLAPAVRASMSLPGIFEPVVYRHRFLVDGGVVDYIPADLTRLLGADWVMASVTEADYTRSVPTNVLLTLEQVIDIRGGVLARHQRQEADFVFDVKPKDIDFLSYDRSEEMAQTGALAAKLGLKSAQEGFILHALPRLRLRWSAKAAP